MGTNSYENKEKQALSYCQFNIVQNSATPQGGIWKYLMNF